MGSEVVGASADAVAVDVVIDGAGETRSSCSLMAGVSKEDEFILGRLYYSRVGGNDVVLL